MTKNLSKIITAIAILISAIAFAENPDGYNIKITVKGLNEGTTCLLACYYGDKNYIKDSAVVNAKGELIFKGKVKFPEGVYLLIPPNKKYFDFIMDTEQIISLETDIADNIKNMKVKGSEENKYFYEYQNFMSSNPTDNDVKYYKLNFIKNHPETFVAKLFKAMAEVEIPEAPLLANGKKDTSFAYRYYKSHFFDNIDLTDARLLRSPIFHSKIKQYMEKLTPQTPDSISISADYLIEKARPNQEVFKYLLMWLTYNYESSKIMGFDAVFVHLVEKYYVTRQAFWVDDTQSNKMIKRAEVLKHSGIGAAAYNFKGKDLNGNDFSINFVNTKYSFIIFIKNLSSPYLETEINSLKQVEDLSLTNGIPLHIVSVYVGDDIDAWREYSKNSKFKSWSNVFPVTDYEKAVTKYNYDIFSDYAFYILDQNKNIFAKQLSAFSMASVVSKDAKNPKFAEAINKISVSKDDWNKVVIPKELDRVTHQTLINDFYSKPQSIYSVGVDSKIMNFAAAVQKKSMWCWAASIQMILKYNGLSITQQQIVFKTFGINDYGDLPNWGASAYDINDNLNGWNVDNNGTSYKITSTFQSGPPNPIYMIEELGNGYPILIGYRSGPNSGHAVLVTGCTYRLTTTGPELLTITVRDPWFDEAGTNGKVVYYAGDLSKLIYECWYIRVRE